MSKPLNLIGRHGNLRGKKLQLNTLNNFDSVNRIWSKLVKVGVKFDHVNFDSVNPPSTRKYALDLNRVACEHAYLLHEIKTLDKKPPRL